MVYSTLGGLIVFISVLYCQYRYMEAEIDAQHNRYAYI